MAGNGVMSELGIGDERMTENDADFNGGVMDPYAGGSFGEEAKEGKGERRKNGNGEDLARKQKTAEELETVGSLPIVVIRNFASKAGSTREELLEVLAQWAAGLTENKVRTLFYGAGHRL